MHVKPGVYMYTSSVYMYICRLIEWLKLLVYLHDYVLSEVLASLSFLNIEEEFTEIFYNLSPTC